MAESVLDIIIRFLKEGTGAEETKENLEGIVDSSSLAADQLDDLSRAMNKGYLTADEANKIFGETDNKLKAQKESAREANKEFSDLGRAFEQVTGVSLPMATAIGVATAGVLFMKDALGDTVKYAMEVKDLALALHTDAEEASRLIQISQDLRISQSQLEQAFIYALRRGYDPTIEGLIKMSGEYQGLETAQERMNYAVDRFGRFYADEMLRVLDAGPEKLRSMSDALQDSALIMDEEGIQKVDEYRLSVDQLGDEWLAFKMTMAGDVIPFLTSALKNYNDGMQIMTKDYRFYGDNLIAANYEVQHSIDDVVKDTQEQNQMITQSMDLMHSMSTGWVYYGEGMAGEAFGVQKSVEGVTESLKEQAKTQDEITRGALTRALQGADEYTNQLREMDLVTRAYLQDWMPDFEEGLRGQAETAEEAKEAMQELDRMINGKLGPNEEKFNETQADLRDRMGEIQGEIDKAIAQGYNPLGTKVTELKGKYDDLKKQYDDNATEHDKDTKRILFNILEQQAAVDGLTGPEVEMLTQVALNWGLVDTSTADATKRAQEALDYYNVTGDFDGAMAMINQIETSWDDTSSAANAAQIAAQNAINPILAAEGDHEINVHVSVSGDQVPEFRSGNWKVEQGWYQMMQSGGLRIVPPGYPNDSYLMRLALSSGEKVVVIPEGMGETNYFNLNMNSNAYREDVVEDFNMLRSLARRRV